MQKHVHIPARTRLEKWFDETCRVLVSLLPIYFDRVAAFAKPLYGFEPLPPVTSSTSRDWERMVIEFLRRQEKAGGPPTAVAVVLDAIGAENLHVERGFQIDHEEMKDVDSVELPELILWPAVYMRSTLHLGNSATQHRTHHGKASGSGGLKKRGSASQYSTEWLPSQGSSEHSSSRVFGSSSTRNLDMDLHTAPPKNRVLEYGPDTGVATSWPHNEWTALVSILDISRVTDKGVISPNGLEAPNVAKDSFRMAEELVAVTYRNDSDVAKELESDTSWKPTLEKAVRIFGVYANSEINAVDAQGIRDPGKQRSTFHIVSLSKYLSMVIMVKDEGESHFLRRRNPLSDEEIREFMDSMAGFWNVSRLFSQDKLPKALSNTRIELIHEEWDSANVDDLVHKTKSAFGLRPSSYPLTEGHRGISFLGRSSSPKKAPRRARDASKVDDSQSASEFFLGKELATLFDL